MDDRCHRLSCNSSVPDPCNSEISHWHTESHLLCLTLGCPWGKSHSGIIGDFHQVLSCVWTEAQLLTRLTTSLCRTPFMFLQQDACSLQPYRCAVFLQLPWPLNISHTGPGSVSTCARTSLTSAGHANVGLCSWLVISFMSHLCCGWQWWPWWWMGAILQAGNDLAREFILTPGWHLGHPTDSHIFASCLLTHGFRRETIVLINLSNLLCELIGLKDVKCGFSKAQITFYYYNG